MRRILCVVSNQLTLATDLRDSQEIIPTLKPGKITPVQAINCFVWEILYFWRNKLKNSQTKIR